MAELKKINLRLKRNYETAEWMEADAKPLPSPQSLEQNLMTFTQLFVLSWSRRELCVHIQTHSTLQMNWLTIFTF